MGKGSASETPTAKKKKKGRPSLLDIQKRILKQQNKKSQTPSNPNPSSSSNPNRRSNNKYSNNHRINGVSPSSDSDQDSDERAQKKQKLLLGLNLGFRFNGPDSVPNGDDQDGILINRKIGFGSDCSGASVLKVTDTNTIQGSQVESGPTTPLPDKKLLEFILDRLQKKDTHGVFSEPVDAEELPDYHDIIKHPMDFGTVRKKLNDGAYANLEQFEKDIFLICSNAMQYNSPDTIFFRQARLMQELAKKDFENLRQDSDDSEPEEPKAVRRGRPPGKGHKKNLDKSPVDRAAPEVSSDAVQDDGDNSARSGAYNLRKTQPIYNFRSADSISTAFKAPLNSEGHTSWYSDMEKEFPASVVKAVLKYGKKLDPSEENKRDTYKLQPASGFEPSAFDIFRGETKHLSVVGLHVQHGYTRSLARFAANLGPVAWKIASRKIEAALPSGVPFGPGWVGENDNMEHGQTERPKLSAAYEHFREVSHRMTAGSHSFATSSSLQRGDQGETFGRFNPQSQSVSVNRSVGDVQPPTPVSVQQIRLNHPHVSHSREMGRIVQSMPLGSTLSEASVPSEETGVFSRGGNGTYPMSASFINSNIAELSESSTGYQSNSFKTYVPSEALHWNLHGPVLELKQDPMPIPPDQNVEFLVPGLLNSKLQIGSSQQPDLVLQL